MSTRITGQEITVSTFVNQKLQAELDHVKELTITIEMAVSLEEYLGGKSRRPDGKFDNLKCEMTVHSQGPGWFDFCASVVAYARRDAGAPTSFDVSALLSYPTGEQRVVVMKRCEFESIDWAIGSRKDMVETKIPFIPDDFEFVS
jgi:hypothetical protein